MCRTFAQIDRAEEEREARKKGPADEGVEYVDFDGKRRQRVYLVRIMYESDRCERVCFSLWDALLHNGRPWQELDASRQFDERARLIGGAPAFSWRIFCCAFNVRRLILHHHRALAWWHGTLFCTAARVG